MHLNSEKLKRYALKLSYPLILALICVFLSYLNWTPNTWQTGWDTLHPEFNWSINIPRHVFGMWQENQGLGNVGGHSHAADSSRILIMLVLSLLMPLNFLRYAYLFFTLIMGPLGAYLFLDQVVFRGIKSNFKRYTVSFFGALFYIFNLGTVQQYIVQLEMYTALYGFIGWIFWAAGKYLLGGKKKNLLVLCLICLLAAPHAYAVTVFLGMFSTLILYLTGTAVILCVSDKKALKGVLTRWLIINLTIILMNSYWFFPSLYFGFKHSSFVAVSNINEHFSSRIFAYNENRGSIGDLLFLKGFLMDWRNYDFVNGGFYKILDAWTNYNEKIPDVAALGYIIVFLFILGFFYLLVKKNKNFLGLFLALFLCVFMYLTSNPPFGPIFLFLKDRLSIFGEMFRNPYTKFSVELILLYSVFAGSGALLILDILEKLRLRATSILITFSIISFFILAYYMYPMFQGQLLSKDVRIQIPNEYFQMYSWLNNQSDTRRIATLPIHSFWGWSYYKWGYQGAGFVWFGMKQPVLDRDFDRWNPYNEEYFYEMSRAVYNKNVKELEDVVAKYGVGYVILDENVMSTEQDSGVTNIEETKKLLSESTLLKEEANFGLIHIYKTQDSKNTPFYTISNEGYNEVSEYPFQEGRKYVNNAGVTIKTDDDGVISLSSKFDLVKGTYKVTYPDISTYEDLIPAKVSVKSFEGNLKILFNFILPETYVNDQKITNVQEMNKEYTLDLKGNDVNSVKLSINEKYFFDVGAINDTYKNLGSVFLTLDDNNSIRGYSSKPVLLDDLMSRLNESGDCSEGNDSKVTNTAGNLSILSGENLGCAYFELKNASGNFLFKTELGYTSEIKSNPGYCLMALDGKCKTNLGYTTIPSKFGTTYIEDYVATSVPEKSLFKIFAPKEPVLGVSHLDYSKINLTAYKYISTTSIRKEEILDSITNGLAGYTFSVEKPIEEVSASSKIDKTLNFSTSGRELYDLSAFDEVKEGSKQKVYENGIKLTSFNDSIYDSISLFNVPNNISYISTFDAQNIQGYPLTVSVEDIDTGKYFMYKKLNPALNMFKVPDSAQKLEEGENPGYRIGFTNFSIGKKPSQNVIKKVMLIPYNGNWLSNLTINKYTEGLESANLVNSEPIVKKYAPFIYKVSGLNPGDLLVFENSFEEGWIATGATNHQKVKGWANGWVVNSASTLVVFLPGFIQIGGYLVVFAVMIGVFILAFRERSWEKSHVDTTKVAPF